MPNDHHDKNPPGPAPRPDSAESFPAPALGQQSSHPEEADDDDVWFDDLGPDEHDAHLLDDDAAEGEIHCPACGELTYDDAPQCANCGHWITHADRTESSNAGSFTIAIIIALLILAVMLWRIT